MMGKDSNKKLDSIPIHHNPNMPTDEFDLDA